MGKNSPKFRHEQVVRGQRWSAVNYYSHPLYSPARQRTPSLFYPRWKWEVVNQTPMSSVTKNYHTALYLWGVASIGIWGSMGAVETHDDGVWGSKLLVAIEAKNVEKTVKATGGAWSKPAPLSDSSWRELKITVRILLCWPLSEAEMSACDEGSRHLHCPLWSDHCYKWLCTQGWNPKCRQEAANSKVKSLFTIFITV